MLCRSKAVFVKTHGRKCLNRRRIFTHRGSACDSAAGQMEILGFVSILGEDGHERLNNTMKTFAKFLSVLLLSSLSAWAGPGGGSGGGGSGHAGGGMTAHSGGGGLHAGAAPRGTAILGGGHYHHYGGGVYLGGYYDPFYWGYYPGYYWSGYPAPAYASSEVGQAYSPSGPSYDELGRFWGRKFKQGGPAVQNQFISFLQSDVLKASDAGRALFEGGFLKTYGKDGGPVLNHSLDEARGSVKTDTN